MAGAGLLLFCAARMLDGLYPIIKSMWTGTFVLAAAGISLTLLSLFHLAVDVWNKGKWALWAFPSALSASMPWPPTSLTLFSTFMHLTDASSAV